VIAKKETVYALLDSALATLVIYIDFANVEGAVHISNMTNKGSLIMIRSLEAFVYGVGLIEITVIKSESEFSVKFELIEYELGKYDFSIIKSKVSGKSQTLKIYK
jgi:hypothetical protein